jgi:hypothetical protein
VGQSGNQVGDQGANKSEALKQNQSVQQLDLVRFILKALCVLNASCCGARAITRAVQGRNQVSVAATCYLISCIVHNAQFTDVNLDHAPSACVGTAAWGNAGLCLCPPVKLWLCGGSSPCPSSEYVVFARFFGNRSARVP